MTKIKFLLVRLLKVSLVGFYALLGVSLALAGYGVIADWGVLNDMGFLHELWVNPWSIVGAILWFGIGILFFNEEEALRERNPIVNEYVHSRYLRNMSVVQRHLEQENLKEAVEMLSYTVEDLADQLNMREV